MSNSSRSNSGRLSNGSSKGPETDTDTSFSSNSSYGDAGRGADAATKLIRLLGQASDIELKKQTKLFRSDRGPPNPLFKEVAKLRDYPSPSTYNWQNADAEDKKQTSTLTHHHNYPPSHFIPQLFHENKTTPPEKVTRIWIPLDPDENPNVSNDTHVRTMHHKSRQQIIRIVQDQVEYTRQVFQVMQREEERFPSLIRVGSEGLAREREAHAVMALRLKGVEVCEWEEEASRVEVYFEDNSVKTGAYLKFEGPDLMVGRRRRADEAE